MADQQRDRSRSRWLPWAGVAAVLVVSGAVGGCTTQSPGSPKPGSPSASAAGGSTVSSCQVTSVADQVVPSVVTIAASGAEGSGTGSGEVIKSDGYILTNNHVISGAATSGGSVQVLFSDGKTEAATITGRDPQTDLAVLKIQPPSGMKVIGLASGTVQVGQPVVAIGAPLGLSSTVTAGIVSALDRTVEVPGENDQNALLVSALQTDAAINPGNSGGALVNCAGQLVGVPTAGANVPGAAGGSIGLGFAIPVALAKSIADEIISTGRVSHAYFGLETVPIPAEAAAQAGLSGALYVQAVTAGWPAARAGPRAGDVITSVGGQPATGNVQLQELSLTKKAGDTVDIQYLRNGVTAKAKATVAL